MTLNATKVYYLQCTLDMLLGFVNVNPVIVP